MISFLEKIGVILQKNRLYIAKNIVIEYMVLGNIV